MEISLAHLPAVIWDEGGRIEPGKLKQTDPVSSSQITPQPISRQIPWVATRKASEIGYGKQGSIDGNQNKGENRYFPEEILLCGKERTGGEDDYEWEERDEISCKADIGEADEKIIGDEEGEDEQIALGVGDEGDKQSQDKGEEEGNAESEEEGAQIVEPTRTGVDEEVSVSKSRMTKLIKEIVLELGVVEDASWTADDESRDDAES